MVTVLSGRPRVLLLFRRPPDGTDFDSCLLPCIHVHLRKCFDFNAGFQGHKNDKVAAISLLNGLEFCSIVLHLEERLELYSCNSASYTFYGNPE